MNTPLPPIPPSSPTPPSDRGDAELLAMLDALALADASAASPELAERVFASSLASLHGVVETSARVSELGAVDRASAAADLEEHVFASSVSVVAGVQTSGLRLVGQPAARRPQSMPMRNGPRRMSRFVGIAAAVLLGGLAVSLLIPTMRSVAPVPIAAGPSTTADIEAQLDAKMDTLYLAMQDVSSADGDSTDAEFKPEWLDDLYDGARNGS